VAGADAGANQYANVSQAPVDQAIITMRGTTSQTRLTQGL
jgi:hypothetical protein